ncbi:MAG: hypothetical protein QQN63_00080 [Nitrosopumilus sp.]
MTNEPTISHQEAAYNAKYKKKQEDLERITEHYAMLSKSHPEAYEIVNGMLSIQLELIYMNMTSADSDFIFKTSGGLSALRELQEKLTIYTD